MDDGVVENAATRWLRDSYARLYAQDDPTRIRSDWAAEGFRYEDRTPLNVMGDHAGAEAPETMERMWRANFEMGRVESPRHEVQEVLAQHSERLSLVRLGQPAEYFGSNSLWVFELDSSLTKLQRIIRFDGDRRAEALEAFDELARSAE